MRPRRAALPGLERAGRQPVGGASWQPHFRRPPPACRIGRLGLPAQGPPGALPSVSWPFLPGSVSSSARRPCPVHGGHLHVLAVSAKPTLVVLPLLLLLIDWWPLGRLGRREGSPPGKLPVGRSRKTSACRPASVAAAVLTYRSPGPRRRRGALRPAGSGDRLRWPCRPPPATWEDARAGSWPSSTHIPRRCLGRVGRGFRWRAAAPRPRWPGAGSRATGPPLRRGAGTWSALLPVSGLVQVGSQAMADRYTLLSMVGLGLAVAGAPSAPRPPMPAGGVPPPARRSLDRS